MRLFGTIFVGEILSDIFTVEELRHWFFDEYPNKDNDINKLPDSVSIYDYLSTIESEENDSKNKIAVINIEGAISTGESMYGVAGSDTIVKNIRKAIKDDDVKAPGNYEMTGEV